MQMFEHASFCSWTTCDVVSLLNTKNSRKKKQPHGDQSVIIVTDFILFIY